VNRRDWWSSFEGTAQQGSVFSFVTRMHGDCYVIADDKIK